MRAWAVVVAAGRGERLGLPYNKVFHPLAGETVLSRCLSMLLESKCFGGIVLVLAPGDMDRYRPIEGVSAVASGGDTRQESVKNGLLQIPDACEVVAVHDAARPFASPALIRAVVSSAERFGSGVAAKKVTDTIKQVDERGLSVHTPDRARLRAVQTPQAFSFQALREAYAAAGRDGFLATDDAQLYEKYIGPVHLVEHADSAQNIKLTTMEDLDMMNLRLSGEPRIGYGYDAHRFEPGRKLVLCGIEVPSDQGLLGHSDADVATHALMDALLGAIGQGDIGRHFPDSDPAYKGISSLVMLEKVVKLLDERGCMVVNVDVTIVAQGPKLAPYMQMMRTALARVLRADESRVNVKATTTEHMGFTGRMEGISASAVALVRQKES